MIRITSLSNPRIKQIVRLQQGRSRRKTGLFLINGVRETLRALECGIEIIEIYVNEAHSNGTNFAEEKKTLFRKISQQKTMFFDVSEPVFEKIAFGQRREGILAVARSQNVTGEESWKKFWHRFELTPQRAPLFAVVEKVEKPGNLGAVFRSADGAGVDAVLIADSLCDLYNPNTIRASLGTVFRVPAIVDSSVRIWQELTRHNIHLTAARCDMEDDKNCLYTDYDFTQSTAIVLGTEADGLSELWKRPEIQAIHLPMLGIADSLNVSNAAAVLFYEARRQREKGWRQIRPHLW